MATKEEYRHVLADLLQVRMFTGIYDAEHGDEHFMHGINTVMAYIADQVSDDTCDNVEDLFLTNMVASQHDGELPEEDIEQYEEPDDIDDDTGFDPFMGKYTFDC